ncbi:MAG: hypothetical protein H7A09_08020 [Oceanospirillaceae bacterium]|nr:hypothetical protein [Oceanospirillaceae bacterium]MCP5335387.1 hypothetical protein [Oceanospirillaceae bacterium]MCP5351442.1 hypothetical protein [Oceanospirillaceae bacterium]
MFTLLHNALAWWHFKGARNHFHYGRFDLCLQSVVRAEHHLAPQYQPKLCAYKALCHLHLKYWDNMAVELEQSLFGLRRHIHEDKESYQLWQCLKAHLTDLRYINRQPGQRHKAVG